MNVYSKRCLLKNKTQKGFPIIIFEHFIINNYYHTDSPFQIYHITDPSNYKLIAKINGNFELTEIKTSGDTDGISAAIKCLSSSQEKSPV
jgi:hypothetical protein